MAVSFASSFLYIVSFGLCVAGVLALWKKPPWFYVFGFFALLAGMFIPFGQFSLNAYFHSWFALPSFGLPLVLFIFLFRQYTQDFLQEKNFIGQYMLLTLVAYGAFLFHPNISLLSLGYGSFWLWLFVSCALVAAAVFARVYWLILLLLSTLAYCFSMYPGNNFFWYFFDGWVFLFALAWLFWRFLKVLYFLFFNIALKK